MLYHLSHQGSHRGKSYPFEMGRFWFKVIGKFEYLNMLFDTWKVVQRVKHLLAMQETQVSSLGWQDPLEKEMATHSSILAWRTPWTEEPGGLQSMGEGGQKAGHSQGTNTFTFKHVVGHLKMGSKALGSAKISLTRTGGYFWSTSESSTMREVVCDIYSVKCFTLNKLDT